MNITITDNQLVLINKYMTLALENLENVLQNPANQKSANKSVEDNCHDFYDAIEIKNLLSSQLFIK